MSKIKLSKEDKAWLSKNKGAASLNAPLPSELKAWGMTRNQYRSLYSKAEKDWKANTGFIGKILAGNNTNEVNKHLLSQMRNSKGSFADSVVKRTTEKKTTAKSEPVKYEGESSGGGGGGGYSSGGGGGGVAEYKPKFYTADELANRFGIVHDYATILKELQGATKKKFDESETTMRRAEASNLRGQEASYNQYLADLRSRATNAVASGATKGSMAANALSSMLGMQEANREAGNTMNDLMYDLAQQRGSALSADIVSARNQSNELGRYFGDLATSMDTNDINAYAARIAAEAQRYAAGVQASATTNAARIGASAQRDRVMDALVNDYIGRGFDRPQARAYGANDYANIIRQQGGIPTIGR